MTESFDPIAAEPDETSIDDALETDRVVAEGISLEVCPASNVCLGVYHAPADVPLSTLLEHGAQVALGADDPLLFQSRLVDQYAIARGEARVGRRFANHTRDLGPRRERKGQPQLVLALTHQQVGKTHATRLDVDEYLPVTGCRIVDLGQLQTIWAGLCGEHLCLHGPNPTRSERSHG